MKERKEYKLNIRKNTWQKRLRLRWGRKRRMRDKKRENFGSKKQTKKRK